MKRKTFIMSLTFFLPEIALATSHSERSFNYVQLFFKTIIYVVIFILVLFATFYGTKFLAKRSKPFFKSKYVEIIDSVNIGSNNRIVIAKVANFIYILSINNNDTILIDKMEMQSFYSKVKEAKALDKDLYDNIKVDNDNVGLENEFKKILDKFKLVNRKIDRDEDKNEEDD
ncbi:flagellar biosynthetic protein FliO [Anaerosalibacter bizertensis]|uniref:flagellar biosynthetic protein FliO n=1 Tax=Anaerosalibacter bizertensis TaxID=932217 RepID=UPI003513CC1E